MSKDAPRWLPLALGALAAGLAARWWWTCDDAFISFRYARNLVDGHGLVFNVGEPVEGFTNLLWTLWCALGLALGLPAETWANAWGLVAAAALVATLARGAPRWPVAAALTLASAPVAIWATGGLETAANLALLVVGWQAALRASSPAAHGMAGAVLALAALTRPDSALAAAVVGATTLHRSLRQGLTLRRALIAPAALSLGFAILWLPATGWRLATYGDLFPNTYYAKSAHLTWWSQGLTYLGLFCRELPLFALTPIVGVWGLLAPGLEPERKARLGSALALALVFTLYVTRVGGGFMHTRLLLPALPFAWVVWEEALSARLPGRPLVAALCAAATAVVPGALGPGEVKRGIVDERAHYDPARAVQLERDAAAIAQHVRGLPVRAAYIGGQARLVYRTGIPTAVEAETGLTDAWIARRPLVARGRVGHEKRAPVSYLVDQRHLHLVFGGFAFRYLGLDRAVPKVGVRMGHTVAFIISWDSALMRALAERGAVVPPFEREAKRLWQDPERIPADRRAATLAKLRRFWPEGARRFAPARDQSSSRNTTP